MWPRIFGTGHAVVIVSEGGSFCSFFGNFLGLPRYSLSWLPPPVLLLVLLLELVEEVDAEEEVVEEDDDNDDEDLFPSKEPSLLGSL